MPIVRKCYDIYRVINRDSIRVPFVKRRGHLPVCLFFSSLICQQHKVVIVSRLAERSRLGPNEQSVKRRDVRDDAADAVLFSAVFCCPPAAIFFIDLIEPAAAASITTLVSQRGVGVGGTGRRFTGPARSAVLPTAGSEARHALRREPARSHPSRTVLLFASDDELRSLLHLLRLICMQTAARSILHFLFSLQFSWRESAAALFAEHEQNVNALTRASFTVHIGRRERRGRRERCVFYEASLANVALPLSHFVRCVAAGKCPVTKEHLMLLARPVKPKKSRINKTTRVDQWKRAVEVDADSSHFLVARSNKITEKKKKTSEISRPDPSRTSVIN